MVKNSLSGDIRADSGYEDEVISRTGICCNDIICDVGLVPASVETDVLVGTIFGMGEEDGPEIIT